MSYFDGVINRYVDLSIYLKLEGDFLPFEEKNKIIYRIHNLKLALDLLEEEYTYEL